MKTQFISIASQFIQVGQIEINHFEYKTTFFQRKSLLISSIIIIIIILTDYERVRHCSIR